MEQKEYEKAEEYMERMYGINHGMELFVYTEIEILDLVLSNKISLARSQGVNVNIMAEPILLQLTEPEITALMSNIFDNAIEACKEAAEGKKWIQIIIRQIGNISFIKVSNSYFKEPCIENNVFASRKKDQGVHGIGLTSVKSIIEKYNGVIDIKYGDKKFTITISFFN